MDYNEMTDTQKLFSIVDDLDAVVDKMIMFQDNNENSVITDAMIKKVMGLVSGLYQLAEYRA